MTEHNAGAAHHPTADPAAALEHLRTLWPAPVPDGGHLTGWGKGEIARQFDNLEPAAAWLVGSPDRYLTTCAMRAVDRGKRGTAQHVVAVPALTLDLDVKGGAHKRQDLPDRDQALAFLKEMPIAPSIVIESGGGFYAAWLFEAPWIVTDKAEYDQAVAMAKGWMEYLHARATERGFGLDKVTANLAHVLRCPGSLNSKYDPPCLVRRIQPSNGTPITRYAPAVFEPYVSPGGGSPSKTSRAFALEAHTGSNAAAKESSALVPRDTAMQDGDAAGASVADPSRTSAALGTAVPTGVVAWLACAGVALGGIEKTYSDKHGGGVVLKSCPSCHGRESAGTIVEGTAHICRTSGALRCKRASCEANEGDGGLAIEVWSTRFLRADTAAVVRASRARDPAAQFSLTDDGNAGRLARRHGVDLRYSSGTGWSEWDSRRWCPVPTTSAGIADRVIDRGRDTARAIFQEAGAAGLDKEEREAIIHHAHRSLSEPVLKRMVGLARCELGVPDDVYDRHLWALNVENGTLDLRTSALRPHRREDLLTKLAGTGFDPNARDDDVEHLLAHACGDDAELREYLERLIGYTLVGEKSIDLLVLLLGRGGTGKTSLIEALVAMLRDYAYTLPFEALVPRKQGGGPRPEIVRTRGVRMVGVSESPEGAAIDAALLKSLAGGDVQNARDLYRTPIRFRPNFTLWIATNTAPMFPSEDSGLRRRLVVVPFDRPVDDVDKDLRGRLRRPNARRALLALAVRGCARWQSEGLPPCHSVEDATARLFEGAREADSLARFIKCYCVADPAAWTPTAEIRRLLARIMGGWSPNPNALADGLRTRGFECVRRGDGRGWRLLLRESEATQ